MDPQINPLVPVLKSPWLMFHVAVIVGAYGFFGISCLLGLVNLVMMSLKKAVLAQRIKRIEYYQRNVSSDWTDFDDDRNISWSYLG